MQGWLQHFLLFLCCIAPLVLFLLGISGAWISYLTGLTPYRPYFLAVAIILTSIGFWKVYNTPKAKDYAPNTFCALPQAKTINKVVLWSSIVIILLALVYLYIAPFLLSNL